MFICIKILNKQNFHFNFSWDLIKNVSQKNVSVALLFGENDDTFLCDLIKIKL